jgi:Capsule polysaccharide biosynthesis protein
MVFSYGVISSSTSFIELIKCQFGKAVFVVTEGNTFTESSQKVFKYSSIYSQELYSDLNEVEPIDASFIIEMSDCERIYLKMLDRYGGYDLYQKRKDRYLKELRFWASVIVKDLDFVIFNNVPHEGFDFIIYCLCKKLEIKTYCFFTLPVVPNLCTLMYLFEDIETQGHEVQDECKKFLQDVNFRANLTGPLSNYIELHKFGNVRPTSFTRAEKEPPPIFSRVIDVAKKFILLLKNYQIIKLLHISKKALIRSILNKIQHDSKYKTTRFYRAHSILPGLDDRYIYFPLHYQPEASTSPLGGDYVEQLLAIEMLSKGAESYGVMVYVKDHPRQVNFMRSIEYYSRILSLPNVRLIDYKCDTYQLIDNSLAVSVITGSAGWEGFLRLKPVIMFGHRFYKYAPSVWPVQSNADLRSALEQIITHIAKKPNEVDVNAYLAALENYAFEGFISQKDEAHSTVSREVSEQNMMKKIQEKVKKDFVC